MGNFLNRLQQRFVGLFERRRPDVPPAASTQTRGRQRDSDYLDTSSMQRDRQSRYTEIRKMLDNDPRLDRMLYKLASDAAYKSFTVNVESADGKRKQRAAQAVIDRTRFLIKDKQKLRGWIKGLLRDGDLFLQLIVKDKEIIQAKKLAAEITYTRLNAEGEFPSDKKPYYQKSRRSAYEPEREFDEWEIVHLKWDSEDGQAYGKSILNSLRMTWRRLDSGEKDIAIRRKMRAGKREHHKIGSQETPGKPEDIKEYRNTNQATLENPVDPSQNIYSNHLVEIIPLMGDETIGDIEDLKWTEGLYSIGFGIPQALLSGGREAATRFTVIKEQEEDYLRVVGDIDEVVEEALRRIFDIALLLRGINPDSVVYVFNWGAKDREDMDKKVERGERLLSIGLSFETVMHVIDLDGVTYEEELKRIEKQIADGIVPYRGALLKAAPPAGDSGRGMSEEDKQNLISEALLGPFTSNGNGTHRVRERER